MSETHSLRDDLGKAIGLVRNGRASLAIPLLNGVIESDPNCALALRWRGLAQSFRDDHAKAFADFSAVISIQPTNPDAYVDRASARQRAGDLHGAIEDYSAAIAVNPQHSVALFQRGRMNAACGNWSEAIADFTADMSYSKMGPLSGLLNRGRAKHRLGDLAGAIEDLSEAMRLECQPIFAPLFRGRVRLDAGDYLGAIADFTAAIGAFPRLTNAYRHRAEAKAFIGDSKGSAEDLRKFEELGGRDLPAYE
jgi:tetratricopeptide (TPR) repeat protein